MEFIFIKRADFAVEIKICLSCQLYNTEWWKRDDLFVWIYGFTIQSCVEDLENQKNVTGDSS